MKKTIGLLGKTLSHSFSKQYFSKKFEREGITDYEYLNFELEDITDLPQLLEKHPNLVGFNVTIPYKHAILDYVDESDEIVKAIAASNTIKISKDKKLTAYNTDVIGFAESIKPLLKKDRQKALVLGNGGAAKAVKYALQQLHISTTIVSRNPQKTAEISYAKLDENMVKNHQIVVNTTPLGMHPNTATFPSFPYDFITKNHIFYDLVYNPSQTIFLKNAEEKGAQVINGLKMLHLQAEAAWKIWTKKTT